MESGFAFCSLILSALLVLQCVYGSSARVITRGQSNDSGIEVYDSQQRGDNHIKIYGNNEYEPNKMHENHPSSHMDHMDPSLNVFFTVRDLYVGYKMPIYFAIKDPSTSPHLLPRQETDSIPFSSSKHKDLLSLFSFSKDSPQAKAMEHTLKLCEMKPIGGEIKFCATSLESMLDSTRGVFGLGTKFKLITTITHPSDNTTLLQDYTILVAPREIAAPKMVACHTMPYPYAVFYCHGSQKGENKVFKVSLGGENGDKVEAVAVCHMDSSKWDKDHVAFTVLRFRPGSAPVCHFFPADNFVWVPSTSVDYGPIEAKKGNPPVMPAVMTPGGPVDLSNVLFRNRIIFIGQPINAQVAQRVISQLVTLATIDEDAEILVYLNCPGGSTYSVLAIYDCMSWIKPKIGTVCFGVAASQGALLLAGGEKGMRYSMLNSRIMIHQPQSGCGGHVEDVRRQVNEPVQSRHKIEKMYAAFTGQPLEKVQQYTERDRFLSVSEAMDFGLIDGVLETEY